eukprot:Seg1566.6 transcript_id=Seg1566.6/GoldUCD/mRNA.D3Y31 product="Selenocysteine-specific elongation factor" protein_id=Seg1566.6/GoldUCD/D3Y31
MASAEAKTLNFNVGVLGHVDSGKTSLSKAISTTASTASFDKNPQSKERGITLDLGFSSFVVGAPEQIAKNGYENLQYTLVDCPGHASLIRTIIGGAQIIDMMMLVVDVTKGMQTQTAECLIIGEILCDKMIVVLNKIDMLESSKRDAAIEKMKKRMLKTLENTRFANTTIVAVAAKPGGPDAHETESMGVKELADVLNRNVYVPSRDCTGPLIYSVDHCFSIRGQGTVMTGTILNGSVSINDTVEIPSLKVTKKVKSMQMFRKPVQRALQGDRVGVCVTQFDPKLLERGLVCSPGALPTLYAAVIKVSKIPYFKSKCETKSKFHITIGHDTVMARLTFFGPKNREEFPSDQWDISAEYRYEEELLDATQSFNLKGDKKPITQYLLLEFEKPVTCSESSLVIGSRLDTDINLNTCRLAFHGKLVEAVKDKDYQKNFLPNLKIFKMKSKEGVVERMLDDYTLIVRSLFKKETNLQMFLNLKVKLSTGEDGVVEGGFGQSGKIKIRVPKGLEDQTKQQLAATQKKKGKGKQEEKAPQNEDEVTERIKVKLEFKKYVFDSKHKIIQT